MEAMNKTTKQEGQESEPYGPRRTFVNIKGKLINTEKVKFINIEEGIFGEDRLTFKYKGKTYTSTVVGR